MIESSEGPFEMEEVTAAAAVAVDDEEEEEEEETEVPDEKIPLVLGPVEIWAKPGTLIIKEPSLCVVSSLMPLKLPLV